MGIEWGFFEKNMLIQERVTKPESFYFFSRIWVKHYFIGEEKIKLNVLLFYFELFFKLSIKFYFSVIIRVRRVSSSSKILDYCQYNCIVSSKAHNVCNVGK